MPSGFGSTPKLTVSILMLISFCGGLAFALVQGIFDIDPLTALSLLPPAPARQFGRHYCGIRNVDVGFHLRGFCSRIAHVLCSFVLIVGPALSPNSLLLPDQIAYECSHHISRQN